MRSPQKNSANRRHNARGFSLLEMMVVVLIVLLVSSLGFISLQPALKQERVSNAYNTVLSAMRLARDNAVAQRTSYMVVLNAATIPHTITVSPTFAGFNGALKSTTYRLPDDIKFDVEPGIPTQNSKTPDSFGTGSKPIDFGYTASGAGAGGQNTIYFCPDGSAQDAAGGAGQCGGNLNSGVVYLARQGDLLSSRAITVWGATGRIRGWRLYNQGAGGTVWTRQ